MVKIKPRPGRLYVILEEITERRVNGIIIQENRRSLSRSGIVQSVGAGVDQDLIKAGILKEGEGIKAGDRVLVSCVSGIIIDDPEFWAQMNQDNYRIYTPSEILATLEE